MGCDWSDVMRFDSIRCDAGGKDCVSLKRMAEDEEKDDDKDYLDVNAVVQ